MAKLPAQVAEFLSAMHIVVAGVSRDSQQPANYIYRKIKVGGHEVFAVNPSPQQVEAEVITTHPTAALRVVHECLDLEIGQEWFHRSFGEGSVSQEAVQACKQGGIYPIVGG